MRRRTALSVAGALAASLAMAPAAVATFPGENGAIAFVREGDIWTIQPDGTDERRLTSGPAQDSSPDWSPDGRRLLFERDGDVYRMHADGTGLSRVLADGHEPDWFRDGERIVFARVVDHSGHLAERVLFSARADGSEQRRIAPIFGHLFAPDPSPTGDFILVHGEADDGQASLFTQSGGIGALGWDWSEEPDEHDVRDGSWSPDGRRLAFRFGPGIAHACSLSADACPQDAAVGLSVMSIDGTDQTNVVPEGNDPAWSPDGRQLAYVTQPQGPSATVHIVRPDGTGRRALVKGSQPDWQPGPARVPPPHDPPAPRVVTVEVPVPGPERIVERVITRTVREAPERCVVPRGQRRFTLVLRAQRTIRAGMGLKVVVDLDEGRRGKATVAKGEKVGLRAGVR